MGSPYVGEIRMFAGSFQPAGWAFCDGRLIPISENDVLFNLIGTTYGGDGQETFALPNLSGRAPMHQGNSHIIGELGGVESVTLNSNQMPTHNHAMIVSKDQGTLAAPAGHTLGSNQSILLYRPGAGTQNFDPATTSIVGGSQPHDNMQPYLVINYIISLFGVYPTQN
jgi:microcystin-dependent protein